MPARCSDRHVHEAGSFVDRPCSRCGVWHWRGWGREQPRDPNRFCDLVAARVRVRYLATEENQRPRCLLAVALCNRIRLPRVPDFFEKHISGPHRLGIGVVLKFAFRRNLALGTEVQAGSLTSPCRPATVETTTVGTSPGHWDLRPWMITYTEFL